MMLMLGMIMKVKARLRSSFKSSVCDRLIRNDILIYTFSRLVFGYFRTHSLKDTDKACCYFLLLLPDEINVHVLSFPRIRTLTLTRTTRASSFILGIGKGERSEINVEMNDMEIKQRQS